MYDNCQGCVLNIVIHLVGVSNHDNSILCWCENKMAINAENSSKLSKAC